MMLRFRSLALWRRLIPATLLLHVFRKSRWLNWLALFALGLLVVAPVISRVLMSGDMSVASSAWCGSHPPGHGDDGHGSPLDKCGYCGYLHHNPLVPGVAVCIVPADVPVADTVVARIPAAVEPFPSLAAHPRGPPLMTFGQLI